MACLVARIVYSPPCLEARIANTLFGYSIFYLDISVLFGTMDSHSIQNLIKGVS